MKFLGLLSLGVLTMAAACMSGESDIPAVVIDPPDEVNSFTALKAAEADLLGLIAAAGPTMSDKIPAGGQVTYTGTMAFTLQDGSMDGVISEAEVISDFASGVITGGADNFFDLEGNATEGSVSIEDTTNVAILGNFIAGNVNGNITFAAGSMDVATGLAGNFSGPDAEYVQGVMSGTATPDSGGAITVQGAVYGIDRAAAP